MWPIQRTKDLMVAVPGEVFKTIILKMLKELKEAIQKVKKSGYEQIGNINRGQKV